MHQVVISHRPLDRLLSVIGGLTAPFHELVPGQESINPHEDGEPIMVGEVNGVSYLLEDHGTAFAMCGDLLVRASRELESFVIGATFDPMEEHCEFFVANRGEMLRAFWSNPQRTVRPYSLGSPLPCETNASLSAPGGAGLKAALRAFGFPLLDHAQGFDADRWVTWKGNIQALLDGDEIVQQIRSHVRAFMNPLYQWPVPKMTVHRVGK